GDPAGAAHAWHPGDRDPLNLGGLTYSLDNVSEANLPAGQSDLASPVNDAIPGIDLKLPEAKPGLLSRSGYAFIDDSPTPVWSAEKAWIEPRPQPTGQDWYLFTYNRDYRKVLAEYAQLCGPIPMIPRWVLGPWITDFNFEYFPDSAESRRPDFQRYINTEQSILSFDDSHAPEVLKVLGRPPPPSPKFDLDLSALWSFRTDHDAGGWKPIRIGPWQERGYGSYRGIGWYRALVQLP